MSMPTHTPAAEERPAILVLADISGYTQFMATHRKALAHSQMIISALLETVIQQVEAPLEVAKLEGDAAFLVAAKTGNDADWADARARIAARLPAFMHAFCEKLAELVATSICKCEACGSIERLRLKVVVHSGEALFYRIGSFSELSGMDVILVHRLLKNSVDHEQYILFTESACRDLPFPGALEAGPVETYDGFDPVPTFVHIPQLELIAFGDGAIQPFASGSIAQEILRYEVRKEYAEVATCPSKGFHFHTGRPLAKLLGYRDEWIDALPSDAVDPMAGTGNPFQIGALAAGERVVDVGCGAGVDSLIAARMVGPEGRVIGVDMTPQMLERARAAAAQLGYDHVEFHEAHAESLPVPDGWADVVISNGALNLCPDKSAVLREMRRVLRPGGRLQIGDIAVQRAVPDSAKLKLDLWTG